MPDKKKKRKQPKITIAALRFHADRSTKLNTKKLFSWVVWQFPREGSGWQTAAVHPPLGGHGWYPAFIHLGKGRIKVYGHVAETFPTPEAAAATIKKDEGN
jgi:hypothetical protein